MEVSTRSGIDPTLPAPRGHRRHCFFLHFSIRCSNDGPERVIQNIDNEYAYCRKLAWRRWGGLLGTLHPPRLTSRIDLYRYLKGPWMWSGFRIGYLGLQTSRADRNSACRCAERNFSSSLLLSIHFWRYIHNDPQSLHLGSFCEIHRRP